MSSARSVLVWFWSGGGGGSTFAVNLAKTLNARFGSGMATLSVREDDPAASRARTMAPDVRVLTAPNLSDRRRPLMTAASLARSASMLREHMRVSEADAVIVPMNFAVAAAHSLLLDKPLVYCAHDPEPHVGDFGVGAQRITQAVLLRKAHTVVALSDYSAGVLARSPKVAVKLRMAPLASVYEPRQALRKPGERVHLLFAGRMIAYKGLDLLATAIASLSKRADWRLTIAGAGPAWTPSMRERFAAPNITIHETWLTDAALDDLIAESDLLLAPYVSATQSGVVCQALAAGTPVVATPVGALPEQIGRGRAGWVSDEADAEAFAAALVRALDDPAARAHKSVAGLEIVREARSADAWRWLTDLRIN